MIVFFIEARMKIAIYSRSFLSPIASMTSLRKFAQCFGMDVFAVQIPE